MRKRLRLAHIVPTVVGAPAGFAGAQAVRSGAPWPLIAAILVAFVIVLAIGVTYVDDVIQRRRGGAS